MPEPKIKVIVTVLTRQPAGEAPSAQLVQSVEYNLAMMVPLIARYLMSIGVPEIEGPAELRLETEIEGQPLVHQVIPNTMDPRTIHHPKVWPMAALGKIAGMLMEGEEIPGGFFDESGNDMQTHYYQCILLARQALGWKES